jgi:hypothetical protein
MKFYNFALISSLILLPFVAARPPQHHHQGPPQQRHGGPTQHQRGKPRDNLRNIRQRRTEGTKKTNAKAILNGTQVQCNMPPFPKLESGCPCFNQETMANRTDYATAEYCYFDQSLGDEEWEYTYFDAGAPQEVLESDPPSYQNSYIAFSVDKSTDPDYGYMSCSAYASISTSSNNYQDNDDDFVIFADGSNESHDTYISLSLLPEQYDACLNVLNEQKAKLPSNCDINVCQQTKGTASSEL